MGTFIFCLFPKRLSKLYDMDTILTSLFFIIRKYNESVLLVENTCNGDHVALDVAKV